MSLDSGTTLGPYQVTAKIGEGGMTAARVQPSIGVNVSMMMPPGKPPVFAVRNRHSRSNGRKQVVYAKRPSATYSNLIYAIRY